MIRTPFDNLLASGTETGDAYTEPLVHVPLAGEFPEETTRRVVSNQLRKARDLASYGVPAYDDKFGDPQAVVDEQGAPLTGFSKKTNTAFDSLGVPRSLIRQPGGAAPVLGDAYEGAEIKTDQKTGAQFKVKPGLPKWRVGTDETVVKRNELAARDKEVKGMADVLGRRLSLDEGAYVHGERKQKDQKRSLAGQIKDDFGKDAKIPEGTGWQDARAYVSKLYDAALADKSASAKEFFSSNYTASAKANRDRLLARKAQALGHVDAMEQRAGMLAQQAELIAPAKEQKRQLAEQRIELHLQEMEARGLDTTPIRAQIARAAEARAAVEQKAAAPQQPVAPQAAAAPEQGGNFLTDTGVSLGIGINSVLKMAGDLYGLATGNMDNPASKLGKENIEWYEGKKSGVLAKVEKERRAAMDALPEDDETGRAWEWVKATFSSPRMITAMLAEQAPNLVPALGAGKLAGTGAAKILLKNASDDAAKAIALKTAGKIGVSAAVGTGAVMQGSDVGGDQYTELVALLHDMPPEQAAAIPEIADLLQRGATLDHAKLAFALTQARTTGALAGGVSIGSQLLPGARILERAAVGLGGKKLAGNIVVRAGKGFLGEGVQEMVEEGVGLGGKNVLAQPVDPTRRWDKGMGETLAMAGATGGILGAVGGAAGRGAADDGTDGTATPPPSGPAAPGAPGTPPTPDSPLNSDAIEQLVGIGIPRDKASQMTMEEAMDAVAAADEKLKAGQGTDIAPAADLAALDDATLDDKTRRMGLIVNQAAVDNSPQAPMLQAALDAMRAEKARREAAKPPAAPVIEQPETQGDAASVVAHTDDNAGSTPAPATLPAAPVDLAGLESSIKGNSDAALTSQPLNENTQTQGVPALPQAAPVQLPAAAKAVEPATKTEITLEEKRAKSDERMARVQEHKRESIESNLTLAGDSGSVEMVSQKRPAVKLFVTPDVGGSGKWRVTQVDEHGPYGHHVFDTREAAIRAASGDSFSEIVKGPHYHEVGEFKVSKVSKPQKVNIATVRPVTATQGESDAIRKHSTFEAGGAESKTRGLGISFEQAGVTDKVVLRSLVKNGFAEKKWDKEHHPTIKAAVEAYHLDGMPFWPDEFPSESPSTQTSSSQAEVEPPPVTGQEQEPSALAGKAAADAAPAPANPSAPVKAGTFANRTLDIHESRQRIAQASELSNAEQEKVWKVLLRQEAEDRKSGKVQGARGFPESDLDAAVENFIEGKRDVAADRSALAHAAKLRATNPEIDRLLTVLENQKSTLESIESKKGRSATWSSTGQPVQWAEKNVRSMATAQKKTMRGTREKIIAITKVVQAKPSAQPSPDTLGGSAAAADATPAPAKAAPAAKAGEGGAKLSSAAKELLDKVPKNISQFVGLHPELREALTFTGSPLTKVEGQRFTITVIPSESGAGKGIEIVEYKDKPGFPVVTGRWMDQWEPYMKKLGVSKAEYDKLPIKRRAEIEATHQRDEWLEGKRQNSFADNFARTYHPAEWEQWMNENRRPSKEDPTFMEKPYGDPNTIRHWEQRFFSKQAKPTPAAPAAKAGEGAKPVEKEPWQMTREDWVRRELDLEKQVNPNVATFDVAVKRLVDAGETPAKAREFILNLRNAGHEAALEKALREGKPVPESVLADYPDIKPAPPAAPAAKAGEGGAREAWIAAQMSLSNPPLDAGAPAWIARGDGTTRPSVWFRPPPGDVKATRTTAEKAFAAQYDYYEATRGTGNRDVQASAALQPSQAGGGNQKGGVDVGAGASPDWLDKPYPKPSDREIQQLSDADAARRVDVLNDVIAKESAAITALEKTPAQQRTELQVKAHAATWTRLSSARNALEDMKRAKPTPAAPAAPEPAPVAGTAAPGAKEPTFRLKQDGNVWAIVAKDTDTGGTARIKTLGGIYTDEQMANAQKMVDEMNARSGQALANQPQQPAPAAKPSANQADADKLRDLEKVRYKTAAQEKEIELLKARIKADPSKWSIGDGVAYRVNSGGKGVQLNRGFRIAEINAAEKLARIVQVADTGLTSSGGDNDRIAAQWIHVAELVREKKYDKPPAKAAPAMEQPAPKNLLDRVALSGLPTEEVVRRMREAGVKTPRIDEREAAMRRARPPKSNAEAEAISNQYRTAAFDDLDAHERKKPTPSSPAPAAAPAPAEPQAKEAWQMTKAEAAEDIRKTHQAAMVKAQQTGKPWDRSWRGQGGRDWGWLTEPHEQAIRIALREGKPVPESVLADYKGEKWADDALAKLKPAETGGIEPPLKVQAYEGAPIHEYPAVGVFDTEAKAERVMDTYDPNDEVTYRKRGDKFVVYAPEGVKPMEGGKSIRGTPPSPPAALPPPAEPPPPSSAPSLSVSPQSISDVQPKHAIPAHIVSRIVDRLLARWPGAAPTTVIADGAQFPQAIREQAAESGLPLNRLGGAYHDGKVWINAAALGTAARVEQVFMHEQAGHHGVDGLLEGIAPGSRAKLAAQLQGHFPAQWAHVAGNYDAGLQVSETLARIHETFATNEATAKQASAWQRIVDWIRTTLAKAGFKAWSRADVEALLRRGIGRLRGEPGNNGGTAQFSIESEQRDKDYMAAVEAGDTETAQRMVNTAAGIVRTDSSIDRGDLHSPAGPNEGAPGYDLTDNEVYPADVYSSNGLRYYGTGADAMDREAYAIVTSLRRHPNKVVRVYRAVEKDSQAGIEDGVWVTTVRAYAKEHGASNVGGDFKIISKVVHAKDIYTSGDSWLEWGYHPQELRNWPKAITRDDSGRVIPLSQRFNPATPDIRFSIENESQQQGEQNENTADKTKTRPERDSRDEGIAQENEIFPGYEKLDGKQREAARIVQAVSRESRSPIMWVNMDEGKSGLAVTDDAIINVDPVRLAESAKDVEAVGGDPRAWIRSAFQEEEWHNRQLLLARGGFEETYARLFDLLENAHGTGFVAMLRVIYNAVGKPQFAAEFERMILQHRASQKITESHYGDISKLLPFIEAQQPEDFERHIAAVERTNPGIMEGSIYPLPPLRAETPIRHGIKNAMTEADRIFYDLLPRAEIKRRSLESIVAQAKALVENSPEEAERIFEGVEDGSAPVTDINEMVVLQLLARTKTAMNRVQATINDGKGKADGLDALMKQRGELKDRMQRLVDTSAAAGREASSALNVRRAVVDEDYSYAGILATMQADNRGVPLTEAQEKIAEVMAPKLEAAAKERTAAQTEVDMQAVYDEVLADIEQRIKDAAEFEGTEKEMGERGKKAARAKKAGIDWFKPGAASFSLEGDASAAKSEKGDANAKAPPPIPKDAYKVVMEYAVSAIQSGSAAESAFNAEVEMEFGPKIKPYLADIFKTATKMKSLMAVKTKEGKTVRKPKVKETTADIAARIGKERDADPEASLDPTDIVGMVRANVEAGAGGGVTGEGKAVLAEAIRMTTEQLQEEGIELTEDEVRDAFTQYGQKTKLKKDSLSVKMREIRRIGQLVSAVRDAVQGKKEAEAALAAGEKPTSLTKPQLTGLEREKATQAVRDMDKARIAAIKELQEAASALGIDIGGAGSMASTLAAAKTRMTNAIEDVEREIRTKQRIQRSKKGVNYDAEATELKAKLDARRKERDEIFGPSELTDEQRLAAALAAAIRNEKEWNSKLVMAQLGIFEPTASTYRPVTSPELEEIKARTAAAREAVADLKAADSATQEAAKEKQLEARIAELEKQLASGIIAAPEKQQTAETQRVTELTARRDELKKAITARRKANQPVPDAEQKKLEALESQLARLIENKPKAEKAATVDTAEQAFARQQLEAARAELAEKRKNQPFDPDAWLAKTEKAIATRTAKLEERLASGDILPPVKAERPTSPALEAARHKYDKLIGELNRQRFKLELANRSRAGKFFGSIAEILQTSRAIITGGELSAVLRQGGFSTLGHPILGMQSAGEMLKSFVSERKAHTTQDEVNHWLQGSPMRSKLDITQHSGIRKHHMEEAYMSRWINENIPAWLRKIPALGFGIETGRRFIAASARAYSTYLNVLRMKVAKNLLKTLPLNPAKPTQAEIQQIADFVNASTGRGKMPKRMQGMAVGLNTVFFAPKNFISRVQLLIGQPLWQGPMRTRLIVAKEYARFLIGAATILALAKLGQDDDDPPIETDLRSSDFLKVRFGNTRLDIFSGLIQPLVFAGRTGTLETKTIAGKVKSLHGEAVKYGGDDWGDVAFRFARTKFAPAPSATFDLLSGRNVVGQPASATDIGANMIIPMTFRDIAHAMEEQGATKGTILSMLAILGMGVNTFSDRKQTPPTGMNADAVVLKSRHELPVPSLSQKSKRPVFQGF